MSAVFWRIAAMGAVLMCFSTPLHADWPLYRGDAEASARAADRVTLPTTLKPLWEQRLEKGWFQTTAIVVGETIYLGSSDLGFSAFDLNDGKERWRFPLEMGVLAPAAYFKGAVYFGDTDGILYALEAETGKLRWKFETGGCIDNSPNVDEKTNRILIGSQAGALHALEAKTGKPIWTYETGDQIRCFPAISGRRCFVAGCDGKLHIVDLDKGAELATVELDAPTGSTPTVHGDRIFFGTEGNEFLAVDCKEAKIVWRFEAKNAFRGPAACKDGLVVFTGMDRTVHAHDLQSGEPRWTFRTKGRMEFSGPVIVGDRVCVPSSDSFLYVLNLRTGEKIQAAEMPGKLLGSPAVVDGRLLLGTDDGVLSCLGE